MNPNSLLLATVSLALLAGTSARAQTILTSPTQPTIGTYDIASFTNPPGAFDGDQDFSNNEPPPGETFTTSGAFPFFSLNSVTVQGVGNAGNTNGGAPGFDYQNANYSLALFSVVGNTATPLGTQTFTFANQSPAVNYSSSYLTFNLSIPLTLAANTQYAYTIAADNGFYGFAGSATSVVTTGGQAVGIGDTTVTNYGYSRNFDIGLTPAPEPSTWALLSAAGLVGFLLLGKRRGSKCLSK